jgi:hypothetical protein
MKSPSVRAEEGQAETAGKGDGGSSQKQCGCSHASSQDGQLDQGRRHGHSQAFVQLHGFKGRTVECIEGISEGQELGQQCANRHRARMSGASAGWL